MSLSTIFNNLDNYIKEGPWLAHVGAMLAFGGLIFIHHRFGLLTAYVGVAVSYTGVLYDRLYP